MATLYFIFILSQIISSICIFLVLLIIYYLNFRYKFQPIQRYKALSAEEAEQEFSKRNKVMNYFSLMLRKRLRNDEDGAEDAELVDGEKGKRPSKKKEKDLKISEMDKWIDSNHDDDSDQAVMIKRTRRNLTMIETRKAGNSLF